MSERHAVIRADASVTIGTGHLVRSRTLAEGLMARGWRTTIVTRDLVDGLAAGLDAASIEIVRLPSGSSIESEPEAIAERVGPDATLVVSDHYGLGGEWFRAMRHRIPGAVLMAIDDLADRPLPVDLVLNQNLGAGAASYASLTSAIDPDPGRAGVRAAASGVRRAARPWSAARWARGPHPRVLQRLGRPGCHGTGGRRPGRPGPSDRRGRRCDLSAPGRAAGRRRARPGGHDLREHRRDGELDGACRSRPRSRKLGQLGAMLARIAGAPRHHGRQSGRCGTSPGRSRGGAGDRVAHVGHVGRHRTGGPGRLLRIPSG